MSAMPVLAEFHVGEPLFGSPWLALLLVLALVAIFIALVALLGRWLAATHPDAAADRPAPVETKASLRPSVSGDVPAEFVPVILAAVAEVLGPKARVASVRPFPPHAVAMPSIEALMQEWSHEGRRQIYSSHKVR